MFQRHLTPLILKTLADTPVVLLQGARQAGKSALAKTLLESHPDGRFLSLEDPAVRRSAGADPVGFISQSKGLMVLDEIQLAPQLFPVIQAEVERDRRRRFLLTGSVALFRFLEGLMGHMELVTLEGLSQGEILGRSANLVDQLFAEGPLPLHPLDLDRGALIEAILAGGFAEAKPARRRGQWFESYLQTLLRQDVRDLSQIEGITQLPRILELLATRSTGLLNLSELSRALRMPLNTLKRYLKLLETLFVLTTLPAWNSPLGKRLAKSPKLMLRDTGLMSHLMGAEPGRLKHNPDQLSGLLEAFVIGEVRKLMGWSKDRVRRFHYRTLTGQGVDLLLERADGRVMGLEIRSSASIQSRDLKGLQSLAEMAGDAFHRGVVLYLGTEVVGLGEKMWGVPVAGVWEGVG
jgi:uncharacterized protein